MFLLRRTNITIANIKFPIPINAKEGILILYKATINAYENTKTPDVIKKAKAEYLYDKNFIFC